MNQFNSIALGAGLLLASQLAYSGSIADTYTSGDTLTATKMGNIKSAVNDNDSNISINTSDISTNASDILTNASDISTNISQISANDSRLSHGFISIPPQAFHSEDESGSCNWQATFGSEYGYFVAGAGGTSCNAVAAVQLPDGVSMATFTCYLSDSSASHSIRGRLGRTDLAGGVNGLVFLTPSTIDNGTIQILADTIPFSVNGEVVDNSTYAYYVAILFTGDTNTVNLANKVHGCKIEY